MPLYLLMGRSLEINSILTGYGPIAQLPLWQQGLIVIVIGDFMGYWTHRINHTNRVLWNVHAVHHSAEIVDWLSAVRVHPRVNLIQFFSPLFKGGWGGSQCLTPTTG
ncbi:MAG TPA: sterol desaturase family protein, partial [Cyanophyceae cyanobacterium]